MKRYTHLVKEGDTYYATDEGYGFDEEHALSREDLLKEWGITREKLSILMQNDREWGLYSACNKMVSEVMNLLLGKEV